MNSSYEHLYTGDLGRFAEQFKAGTWAGTAKAGKQWPKGIPGQTSIVAFMAGAPFKRKGTGFLALFSSGIERHRKMLNRRGRHRVSTEPLAKFALPAEHLPPTGQAYGWYQEVIHYVPLSAMHVAKQLARLAGDDCGVTIPWRSLADAVGKADRLNRTVAYVQRGVEALVDGGWLTVETVGSKRGAKTTFSFQVGDHSEEARRTASSYSEDHDLLIAESLADETD
ncbi:hypothetical protein WQO_11260 [Streptomyces globisporus C-1027]|uniref:Uncharacterized protein n=1 Tax=Streptomyces globisporus C-1027 TaxID=1172567 RepID=A0A0U3LP98_STRGL|nr:hypothetical protein [Streptomyces globisporus]ALU93881.1 hypothetical protein WQO_11260 [Streptomyces globisporus C-1027]